MHKYKAKDIIKYKMILKFRIQNSMVESEQSKFCADM